MNIKRLLKDLEYSFKSRSFLKWQHYIREGVEKAVNEEWELIDNTIIPTIINEFKEINEYNDLQEENISVMYTNLYDLLITGRHKYCERCISEKEYICDNVRDFGATLSQELIKHNCIEPFRIGNHLLEKLEELLDDEGEYVRFRAACALTEACQKKLYSIDNTLKQTIIEIFDGINEEDLLSISNTYKHIINNLLPNNCP